ncbi:MAG: T9SS type A sorting domain-containing protein [Bacteroidia bacterium]
MKKVKSTLCLVLLLQSGLAQWNYHTYLPLPVIPNWTVYFNDAVFTSIDTGYYCFTTSGPSPSSLDDAVLNQTTNNCNTWGNIFWNSDMGVSSYAVKYFEPYLYYFRNWQGIFRIQRTISGSGWQYLPQTFGYYRDFFSNDTSDYKILYTDYSNRIILRTFENNIEIQKDTFFTNKPGKINYPLDTLGILLSTSFPSTGFNTTILRYIPSGGYNIVYQNQNQNLSDLFFPSVAVGYISCDSGLVLQTNDSGLTWNNLMTGFNNKLNSIYFINDSCGYSVGNSGLIIKTSDYGLYWQQQNCPINANLNKVLFVNDSIGYILSGQTVLKTLNGGITWKDEMNLNIQTLKLIPNPSSSFVNVILPINFSKNKPIIAIMYDIVGRKTARFSLDNESDYPHFDVGNAAKGMYTVKLVQGDKSYVGKLIVE